MPVPEQFDKYLTGVRLNLGCGAAKLDGFINADLYGEPDIRFDARDPWPVSPGSVDSVFAHHVLEHFSGSECVDVVWEIGRALRAGGHFVGAVPYATHAHAFASVFHKQGFTEGSFGDFDRKTFAEGGVSAGMDQGFRLHDWTTVDVFLVPLPEYEHADFDSEEFRFALRHYLNVIREMYFVLRKNG
jgi:SAM-dependent methyltransferase